MEDLENMSYINCYNNNYYGPNKSLQDLFEDLVIRPFDRDLPELAMDVKNKRAYYWQDIARILHQGQSNFDQTSFDESSNKYYFPEHKVSVYCVHYMPMHLFSSYHIFTNHLPPVSDKVVFIDFGCGPLTSGIAFRAFAGQSAITYLGIDSSRTMLDKAAVINKYGPNKYREPFFHKFELIHDYNYDYLIRILDKYIEDYNKTQIIFNFCYSLASETLDISNLSNIVTQIMKAYGQHKMYLVYQNPDHRSLSGPSRSRLYGKWEKLKNNLLMFGSQVTKSDLETFSYRRLINSSLHNGAEVYYETCYYQ